MNAVAGGGSFIAFPALVFTGVPVIPANATNTVALWTGIVFSGGAFRERLDVPRRVMVPLLITSFIGGVGGAFLLLKTPEHTFAKVLPWLMAGATLLFIFGKKLARRGAVKRQSRCDHGGDRRGIRLRAGCRGVWRLFRRRSRNRQSGDAGGHRNDRYPRHERAQKRVGQCDQRSGSRSIHPEGRGVLAARPW